MTELALRRTRVDAAPLLYAAAIFVSAALVFLVQPMIARMLLPQLGGSPAVWNASMAFFQAALLAGYGYAHLLQRLRSDRLQAAVHLGVLAAAFAFLPLRVTELLGPPPASGAPALWLMSVLTVSVGAPFAALSATAPLLQAWFSRRQGGGARADPYVLYAASNLGSLLALAAYPLLVEPLAPLAGQGRLWTAGYLLFGLLAAAVALTASGRAGAAALRPAASPLSWAERARWIGLSALPSSLLLGVTNHITTDVASAPFLWVLPLALYLLTFVVAFAGKPLISTDRALFWQAGLAATVLVTLLSRSGDWTVLLLVNLAGFFFSALICHQALAARRPPADRLTEFYLLMSLGGVLGGMFTAFAAPLLLDFVWEYPAALVLVGLVRPWGRGRLTRTQLAILCVSGAALLLAVALASRPGRSAELSDMLDVKLALVPAALGLFLLRDRALVFVGLSAVIAFGATTWSFGGRTLVAERGFFGVHRVAAHEGGGELGDLRLLFHGTTMHGAQALSPEHRCRPLTYYAPGTPIHQAFTLTQARTPAARLGVTGLGAGSVAAITRPADRLRFFEIDPLVLKLASDPRWFTFMSSCAEGRVDTVLGDARLTLAREPAGGLDLLLMDAFSSDSVPTHLLTREAVELYLGKLKPDGVLVVHVTNRHLALQGPVGAAMRAAGARVLVRGYVPPPGTEELTALNSDVMVASRDPETLAAFAEAGWTEPALGAARPWTDDYVNLIGALIEGARR